MLLYDLSKFSENLFYSKKLFIVIYLLQVEFFLLNLSVDLLKKFGYSDSFIFILFVIVIKIKKCYKAIKFYSLPASEIQRNNKKKILQMCMANTILITFCFLLSVPSHLGRFKEIQPQASYKQIKNCKQQFASYIYLTHNRLIIKYTQITSVRSLWHIFSFGHQTVLEK